jgi:hypothetical protein
MESISESGNSNNENNSNNINTNIIKPDKKQDIANKMKENTKLFFNQLKIGCHRKICYNPYCKKSKCNYINKY